MHWLGKSHQYQGRPITTTLDFNNTKEGLSALSA